MIIKVYFPSLHFCLYRDNLWKFDEDFKFQECNNLKIFEFFQTNAYKLDELP